MNALLETDLLTEAERLIAILEDTWIHDPKTESYYRNRVDRLVSKIAERDGDTETIARLNDAWLNANSPLFSHA